MDGKNDNYKGEEKNNKLEKEKYNDSGYLEHKGP